MDANMIAQCYHMIDALGLRRISIQVLIIAIFATSICSCSKHEQNTNYPDQSNPEATIRSYLELASRGDWKTFRTLVKPGDKDSDAYLRQFERFAKQGGRSEVTNIRLDVVEQTETIARIQMSGHFRVTDGDGKLLADTDSGDFFSLVKIDNRWYFWGLGQPLPPGWIQPR
jgi:hypothetical protein